MSRKTLFDIGLALLVEHAFLRWVFLFFLGGPVLALWLGIEICGKKTNHFISTDSWSQQLFFGDEFEVSCQFGTRAPTNSMHAYY